MPNTFAFLMLMIWPLVMIAFFKKMSPDRALIWSFLGAFMFLPEVADFDFPLFPELNKHTIPAAMALLLCLTMVKHRIKFFPKSVVVSILMVAFVLSPFFTVLTNREPIILGIVFLPGLTLKEAIGESMRHMLVLIPFILSFNLLTTPQARTAFLTAFMTAGLIYSVPMLLEVRLSPQLNAWVYGFLPEVFSQQIRFGGFRPVVFMGHGLVVAFFALMTVLATAVLCHASSGTKRVTYLYVLGYLLVVLVLCKSVGPVLFASLFLPIILLFGPRMKRLVLIVCATFVLSYPVLRAADLVPVDRMVGYAGLIQAERAQSLEFRFDNEKVLLDHAAQKPLFGWGFWNRNQILDEEDGRELAVTDGYWIIIIGVFGWLGYICIFGLLTSPLFGLWLRRKKLEILGVDKLSYGIALMMAVNLLELIPNASISNLTWMMAGLLLASATQTERADNVDDADAILEKARRSVKTVRSPRGEGLPQGVSSESFQRKKRMSLRDNH